MDLVFLEQFQSKGSNLTSAKVLCECQKYQTIIDGKGEFQFSDNDFKKDIYFLPSA